MGSESCLDVSNCLKRLYLILLLEPSSSCLSSALATKASSPELDLSVSDSHPGLSFAFETVLLDLLSWPVSVSRCSSIYLSWLEHSTLGVVGSIPAWMCPNCSFEKNCT